MRAICFTVVMMTLAASPVSGRIQINLQHDTMQTRIGYPAIIKPGQEYPSLKLMSERAGILTGKIIREDDGELDQVIIPQMIKPDQAADVTFPGTPAQGRYCIQLQLLDKEEVVFKDAFYFSVFDPEQLPANYSVAVYPGPDGRLVYTPDYRGNRIPDFSRVGYKKGAVPIPEVPVKVTVEPQKGDNTKAIQTAIDRVSAMPPDEDGFRGAVLLKRGVYEIKDALRISAGGVVLRGEGQGDRKQLWLDPAKGLNLEQFKKEVANRPATILVASGTHRRTLVRISGTGGISAVKNSEAEITDNYVPVGATAFNIEYPDKFKVGDKIIVERRSNAEWIAEIGMNTIPARGDGRKISQWKPFVLRFETEVMSIDGNRIEIDTPVVNAIEKQWGGGRIYKYTDTGRISNSGIESLRAISFWRKNADGVDDTRHANQFMVFSLIRDGWARNITVEHFYNGGISLGRTSREITVEYSSNLIAHRSFYAGRGYDPSGRTFYETGVYTGRYGFTFSGQNGLVRECYATNNRHAFAVNARIMGPNVFVNCKGTNSLTYSEPHQRWSTAGLFDNVEDTISIMNRLSFGTGQGWAGANYVAWNTSGPLICEQPPTAQNWAIGHVGKKVNGPFHQWNLDKFGYSHGYWESHGRHVEPKSLYDQQQKDRAKTSKGN